MGTPEPQPQDLEKLRQLVAQIVDDEEALADFEDTDLKKLWGASYSSKAALRSASRKDLNAIGLAAGLVDLLVSSEHALLSSAITRGFCLCATQVSSSTIAS